MEMVKQTVALVILQQETLSDIVVLDSKAINLCTITFEWIFIKTMGICMFVKQIFEKPALLKSVALSSK